jgi:hypothetical protein
MAIPPGFSTRYNHRLSVIWNVFQNVIAKNNIVLVILKGKSQMSALTSANGESKSVVVNSGFSGF